MTAAPDCFFEAARLQLGLNLAEWSRLLRDWAGMEHVGQLYGSSPDADRARRRLVDRLIVMGLRHPHAGYISADYAAMMDRLRAERFRSECDPELLSVLNMFGHPAEWPYRSMTGKTFRGLVGFYNGSGLAMPELARNWIQRDHLSYLGELCHDRGFDDRRLMELLRDYGGGVLVARHLDQAGFDRVQVALEAITEGALLRDAVRKPDCVAESRVDQLWPDWRRSAS